MTRAYSTSAQDSAEPDEDLFEHAACGLISADGRGRILRANRTLATLLGAEPGALVGRHFVDLLSIGSRLYYETHFAPLLRMSGAIQEVALDFTGPAGVRIPALVNAIERRDEVGDVLSVSLAVFPASERRRYERNLLAAKSTAEGAVSDVRHTAELREQLMAILGHDLRNPLAAITSGLNLLKREHPGDRAKRVIGLMEGSVVRASVLIDNVLDFARGRLGGGIELKRDAGKPLAPIIEQVISETRLIAPGRTIAAELDIPYPVAVDPGRMGQLVSNLLGNALTHGAEDQPVSISARVVDGSLELSVVNGGEPIAEDTMENLFRPFVRGPVKDDRHGLGLGLFIASEIAKAHGGTLTAASTHEETRFTFRMRITATEPS